MSTTTTGFAAATQSLSCHQQLIALATDQAYKPEDKLMGMQIDAPLLHSSSVSSFSVSGKN